jgi:glycosyltransferase involved in cell wall biosynthesis
MREPRLSVIIPVFNGEAYLADAIGSVRSQAHPDLEIIVVDDGSTDGTARISRGLGDIRWLFQDNRGPAAARNRGLEAAGADIVAFLDADDLWSPVKLRVQVPRLLDDPRLDSVSGHVQCVKPDGPPGIGGRFVSVGAPRLLPLFGSMVARRRAFERVGQLDESLRLGEDVDWFMRAREYGLRTAVVAEVVLYYRLHGGNTTYGRMPREVGYARAVKKVLDRRREMQHRPLSGE